MQDLIVSINNNKARVTTIEKNEFKSAIKELDETVVKGTKIIDAIAFANELQELIPQVTSLSKDKLGLNFVIEPEDIFLKFVTVNKRDGAVEDQLTAEIQSKTVGKAVDDWYFSNEKIAPFLYQLVGVPKNTMETYMQVAGALNMSLKSVVPWVLLLPKYVNVSEPAIFLSNIEDKQVIAIAELGGVFFSGVYTEDKSPEEIQKIVRELSFYKRSQPIQKIFALNYKKFFLGSEYSMTDITLPVTLGNDALGYEVNILVNYMLDQTELLPPRFNLLNLLPTPVVEKKASSVMTYVGVLTAVALVAGGMYGGLTFLNHRNANNNQVLGDASQTTESTQTAAPTPTPSVTPTPQLIKKDLKVYIENGAGVDGLAKKTQTYLGALGYSVTGITTADNSQTTTTLRFKKSKLAFKSLIELDTGKIFPDETVEDTLDESSAYDLLIVVGTSQKLND